MAIVTTYQPATVDKPAYLEISGDGWIHVRIGEQGFRHVRTPIGGRNTEYVHGTQANRAHLSGGAVLPNISAFLPVTFAEPPFEPITIDVRHSFGPGLTDGPPAEGYLRGDSPYLFNQHRHEINLTATDGATLNAGGSVAVEVSEIVWQDDLGDKIADPQAWDGIPVERYRRHRHRLVFRVGGWADPVGAEDWRGFLFADRPPVI